MKVRAVKQRASRRQHRAIIRRKWERACNDIGASLARDVTGIGGQMSNALRQLARSLFATVGQEFFKGSLLGGSTSEAFSASGSNAPWCQPIGA